MWFELSNQQRFAERYLGILLVITGFGTALVLASSFIVVSQNAGRTAVSHQTTPTAVQPLFSEVFGQPQPTLQEDVYGVQPAFARDSVQIDIASLKNDRALWREQQAASLAAVQPLTSADMQLLVQLHTNPLDLTLGARASIGAELNRSARPYTHQLLAEVMGEFRVQVEQLQYQLDVARPIDALDTVTTDNLGELLTAPTPSTPSLELAEAYLLQQIFTELDATLADSYATALTRVAAVSVQAGLHYPIDVTLSQQVAEQYYAALGESRGYQLLLVAARNEW